MKRNYDEPINHPIVCRFLETASEEQLLRLKIKCDKEISLLSRGEAWQDGYGDLINFIEWLLDIGCHYHTVQKFIKSEMPHVDWSDTNVFFEA